jgi:hypothetical protein
MDDSIKQNMNDHDILIVVHTKLDRVLADVQELKNNFAGRIDDLEIDYDNLSRSIISLKTELDTKSTLSSGRNTIVWSLISSAISGIIVLLLYHVLPF